MTERMTIEVSFKRNEKELYEKLNTRGDKSNYIKDAVRFYEGYMNSRTLAKPLFRVEEMQEYEI